MYHPTLLNNYSTSKKNPTHLQDPASLIVSPEDLLRMSQLATQARPTQAPTQAASDMKLALLDPDVALMFSDMISEALTKREQTSPLADIVKKAVSEEYAGKVKALEDRVQALESALSEKVTALEAQLRVQKNEFTDQKAATSQHLLMNNVGKTNNLMVSGLAETADEDTKSLIATLTENTDTSMGNFTATRVGKVRAGKGRPILVTCQSHWDKRRLYASRLLLRTKGYENTYINEDLTPKQSELFYHTRKAKLQKLIHTSWTDNGTFYIKRIAGAKATMVSSVDDLKELLPTYTAPVVASS
jgi:hypothetical protein